MPVQAKTSSIVISSGPLQPGHRGISRTHHAQLVLQLPEPHTQLLCQNCTSGQISASTSPATSSQIEGASTATPSVGSSVQGTVALEQLCSNKSKVQKAQGKKVMIASHGPISAPSQASGQVIAAGLETSCVKTACGSAVSPYQLCLLTWSNVLIATNSADQAAELNNVHSTF